VRLALVVSGGFDRSGREHVIPALLWLVERLARAHTVHVFVLRHYPKPCTYELLGATIHDLGRASGLRGWRSLSQTRRLVRALRQTGPFDVVHAYWAMPAGLLASLAGRGLGVPTLVTFDSGELVSLPTLDYGLQRAWSGRFSVAATARLATRLHVCSEYMEGLARAAGLRTVRVPLGIDRRVFSPRGTPPPGPPWRLLHVASLNRIKDQSTLLRAFARVAGCLGDVHLDIVGQDTLGGTLQDECVRLGLERRVTFHGFQPTDRLPAFYQTAHLLVMSSRHEAAGVVVLEAAASGVATIGPAVGYIADWAPDAAVAVPPGRDGEALADAIVALLNDEERRDRIAREATRRAIACDADWTASAMERLYQEVQRVHKVQRVQGSGTP
jgi:glycosyltransferase involved in cell wall biosynthesis